jgi:2-dehydro-3-deoxygluconokinase
MELSGNKLRGNKAVTFGEVMLRLSTPGNKRFMQSENFTVNYAGAEANVAVSLQLFGVPSAHVTRFPENDLGKAATQSLQQSGVDTSYVRYGDGRMGLYFLENGSMQRASRIIYDRFDSAFSRISKNEIDWKAVLQGANWFHYTGITPAISPGAADACLEALSEARKNGITISGDINYRRNLWQYGKTAIDVMPSLVALTDIVIAGESDMENCCAIRGKDFQDSCALMMKKFPSIRKIATTVRETVSSSHNKISARMWNGKTLCTSREYDLTHIVDRIGAGDAFMAGLIYGFLNSMSDQAALEFGSAAGAWKHSVEGDVNLASVREIMDLVQGENVGKLLR